MLNRVIHLTIIDNTYIYTYIWVSIFTDKNKKQEIPHRSKKKIKHIYAISGKKLDF